MNQPDPFRRYLHVPGGTYRLQFNRDFTFLQAEAILNYLRDLGITDVYSSPLFQAGPDSTHGYDICCFGKINSNIGSDEDFHRFSFKRAELGLGLLLDMVPNHMGAALANGWWLDVLEHGPESSYANFFDIDWNPASPALKNKVLLPVLGDHYAKVLERGELKLGFAHGKFLIHYFDRAFPVSPKTIPFEPPPNAFEMERSLADFNGIPGDAHSFDRLHALIQRQHFRLAFWRVASEEINYRRFFDVTELVSLRMERPEVFEASHAVVFEWLKAGIITGLRIDHPDGLLDPEQYFKRLQTFAADAGVPQLYVVVEKILSGDEPLPGDWPVCGTTGYDSLNRVNGLFVNPENAKAFTEVYRGFVGTSNQEQRTPNFKGPAPAAETSRTAVFKTLVYQSKTQILKTSLVSELVSLTHRLQAVAADTRAGIDFTFHQWQTALREIIAAFPVYRTYITRETQQPSPQDSAVIQQAIATARTSATTLDLSIFDFLQSLLTLQLLPQLNAATALRAREFIQRFQQLTGPVMAKGLEDTTFYNYNRLISLNEVGGAPDQFGVSVRAFHEANLNTAKHWPHTLLATATHDTKRGEDARARINVLSEIPKEWARALTRWRDWNAPHKIQSNGNAAPTGNDEYLLYQSLVGALPEDASNLETLAAFRQRASAFMLKAVKEAKANTSWTDPNPDYETAIQGFTERVLTDNSNKPFLDDLKLFVHRIAFFGRLNSLAQTVLKLTSPGVPDFYQGTELWDFSFVDPDNRRPVDYDLRRRLLAEVKNQSTPPEIDASGKAKLFVISRVLDFRKRFRELFERGEYVPLPVRGARASHVCSFGRSWGDHSVIVIVPRLVCGLVRGEEVLPCDDKIWSDTAIELPASWRTAKFHNVLTGEAVNRREGNAVLPLREVLKTFPVACLGAA